jgi:hypothetical protein
MILCMTVLPKKMPIQNPVLASMVPAKPPLANKTIISVLIENHASPIQKPHAVQQQAQPPKTVQPSKMQSQQRVTQAHAK